MHSPPQHSETTSVSQSSTRPPTTLEAHYNARIYGTLRLRHEEGKNQDILMLISNVSNKTLLHTEGAPIIFSLPNGRQTEWIDTFGVIKGMSIFVVGDGIHASLGIYESTGDKCSIIPERKDGTSEVISRVLPEQIEPVQGNPIEVIVHYNYLGALEYGNKQ